MGRFAENALQLFREQMGIRTNGKICSDFFKQKTKWEDFSENVVQRGSFQDQNANFLKMGIGKIVQGFREQMGIRTNGNLGQKSFTLKRKWDPICSRAYKPYAQYVESNQQGSPYEDGVMPEATQDRK